VTGALPLRVPKRAACPAQLVKGETRTFD